MYLYNAARFTYHAQRNIVLYTICIHELYEGAGSRNESIGEPRILRVRVCSFRIENPIKDTGWTRVSMGSW